MAVDSTRPLFLTGYTPDLASALQDASSVKTLSVPVGKHFVRLQNDADVLVTIAYGAVPADPQAGDLKVLASSMEWIQVASGAVGQCKIKVVSVSGACNISPIYGS